MISDSIPWRDELLRVADRLEQKSFQKRWSERSSFIVERDIMTSAYAIRRLLEAGKVSRKTYAATVPVLGHAATGLRPDMWNRHELEELYDLESPRKTQLALRKYCNQLIHSYVWAINADEHSGLFDGVFAASEKDCREQVFFVPVKSMVDVCRRIGGEEIWGSNLLRDSSGAAYFVSLTQEEVKATGRGPFPSKVTNPIHRDSEEP
jgi:hypothetical protein